MITIKYFGLLTDITNTQEESISLGESIQTIANLHTFLTSKYSQLSNTNFTIAVNQQIVNQETILNSNDIVALLPPFAGG